MALRLPLRLLHMLQSMLDSSGAAPGGSAASPHTAAQDGQQAGAPSTASELRGEGSVAGAAPATDVEELSAVEHADALSLAEKAVAVMPEVEPRIELRRCPRRTAAATDSSLLRVTSRKRLDPYALKVEHATSCFCAVYAMHCIKCCHCSSWEEAFARLNDADPCAQADQLPDHVRTELDAFQRWGTTRFFGAQADPVQPVTMQKYCDHMRCVMTAVRHSCYPGSADHTPHVPAAPCTNHQDLSCGVQGNAWVAREPQRRASGRGQLPSRCSTAQAGGEHSAQ